jgi:N-acetylglucosaminyldiphosphoundecaprenol N-acetyl-beta-D-mannosaminyltransferase
MSRKIKLLNAEVDDVSMDELVEKFREGVMLTLHVDMIMKLQKDRDFYGLLPKFDVVTCDSQILTTAARLLGTPLRERVSGSDYFPRFYWHYRNDPAVSIFICGGAAGVADMARDKINSKVGREMVVGAAAPSAQYERDAREIEDIITQINRSGATVLLVGLGGGRQEKFIFRYRDRLPHVRLFLPLGGTIDYEAEALRRPPAWITNAGLEWLYRVLHQPRQRWRRYFVHQPPFLYLFARQLMGIYHNPFADPYSSESAASPPNIA